MRDYNKGFGSVFAAVILLWVGIWMHSKSQAGEWQCYIHDKLGRALVYREIFETILLYAAIWDEENAGAVIAGAATAVVVLAAGYLGVDAIQPCAADREVLFLQLDAAGSPVRRADRQGVAALQEAGWLPIHHLAGFIRLDFSGFYPTVQGLSAQVIMALLLAIGFWHNQRRCAAVTASVVRLGLGVWSRDEMVRVYLED